MRKILISLIALVLSFNLSAQFKDIEIRLGGGYLLNRTLDISPKFASDFCLLTSVYNTEDFKVYTGVKFEGMYSSFENIHISDPSKVQFASDNLLVSEKFQGGLFDIALPVRITYAFNKVKTLHILGGLSIKHRIGTFSKTEKTFFDASVEKEVKYYSIDTFKFSSITYDLVLGLKIKLFGSTKHEFFVEPYIQKDFRGLNDLLNKNAYSLNLNLCYKLNFNKNE